MDRIRVPEERPVKALLTPLEADLHKWRALGRRGRLPVPTDAYEYKSMQPIGCVRNYVGEGHAHPPQVLREQLDGSVSPAEPSFLSKTKK